MRNAATIAAIVLLVISKVRKYNTTTSAGAKKSALYSTAADKFMAGRILSKASSSKSDTGLSPLLCDTNAW